MDTSRYNIRNLLLTRPSWSTVAIFLSLGLALIGTWSTVFRTETKHYLIVFSVTLGTYVLIIAGVAAWREIVYSRKARYAEAIVKFHKSIHCLRDAFGGFKINEESFCRRCIEECLSFFASAFSLITGVHCRSCIKTLDYVENGETERNFYTITFARGGTTISESLASGSSPESYYEQDWLEHNSDFLRLFRVKDNKFFSNDLCKEETYRNSHWPSDPSDLKEFLNNKKYSYISTIVWPIRRKEPPGPEGKQNIIGFLCIDSKTRGVFSDRYDVDAGAILADALYLFFEQYRTTFPNIQEQGGHDEPKKITSR